MKYLYSSIFLINLCQNKQVKSRALLIDTYEGQIIFRKVLDQCFQYDGHPDLSQYSEFLPSFFNKINIERLKEQSQESYHWETLFKCFFAHLFIYSRDEIDLIPFLLKIDNRIFIELYGEITFPPEVLSIIKREEYPDLFNYIKHPNAFNEYNPSFTKYLIKENGNECLLIPELPLEFRQQLFNLYGHFIDIFKTFTFPEIDPSEVSYILDYLVTLQQFLNPE